MDEQLSRALRLYYAEGRHPTRYHDAAVLSEIIDESTVDELIKRIDRLTAKAFELGRRYDHLDLWLAMDAVNADMRQAHPELSQDAITALGLYWSYCNR